MRGNSNNRAMLKGEQGHGDLRDTEKGVHALLTESVQNSSRYRHPFPFGACQINSIRDS